MADESLVGEKFRHGDIGNMVVKEYVGRKLYMCKPTNTKSKHDPVILSERTIQDYQLCERIFA